MKNNFIDTIKILIYKENPQIVESINFDDKAVSLEPLLFAYFSHKKYHKVSNDFFDTKQNEF